MPLRPTLVEIEQLPGETDPLEDRVLLTEIIRAVVSYPERVSVTERVLNKNHIRLLIRCDPRDRGKIVGKTGKTIGSVRQIFHAVGGIDRRIIEIDLEGDARRPTRPPPRPR